MSNEKVKYIITDTNISVSFSNQTHIVARTDALAERLLAALKANKMSEIPELVSAARRIEKFSDGAFVVKDGQILVDGQPAPSVLGNKIVKFANEGLPYQPLVNFSRNLQNNPSFRSVQELYSFLEKNDHPLTEDGNFIAYKRVRKDFKDIHSGTFDNSVGTVVSMPRNQVNEDAAQTCSNGLHVANWDYAHNHFASYDSKTDIMLEVEVNPAHVVSIPVDYDNSKMRVCQYKVLGVVDEEHSSAVQLRKTHDDVVVVENSDVEFPDEENCEECGRRLEYDEERYCDFCAIDQGVNCENCGCETDIGFDLCQDCEDEQRKGSVEDEADYPFEDELK